MLVNINIILQSHDYTQQIARILIKIMISS